MSSTVLHRFTVNKTNLILDYYGNAADSLVMSILRRHETLFFTHQDLVGQLGALVEELELGQKNLEILKQEHNTKKLVNR